MPESDSTDTSATSIQPPPGTGVHAQPETETRRFLPIRRILCPVDFSDWSRAAVDQAVALAGPTQAEITGLFVLPSVFPAPSEAASCACADEADASMMSAMAEDLEEFLGPARKAGLTVRGSIKRGACVAQIIEQARESEADVIVMGTHGRSGFQRWVLGSVTDSVLRKAPCPVLAVPLTVARSMPPGPLHGRILCAVGLSERSARTLSYALDLGRSTGSTVTLLHVWDGLGGPRARAIWEAEVHQRLHGAVLADSPSEPPCEDVVLSGPAYREILRLAEAQQTGLIVLGGDDRGLGATASRVVREARAPVLIVRSAPVERQS